MSRTLTLLALLENHELKRAAGNSEQNKKRAVDLAGSEGILPNSIRVVMPISNTVR